MFKGVFCVDQNLDAAGRYRDGQLLTANLGAPASWLNGSTNTWSGDLTGNAVLGFTVRDSEIASTVKVPDAQGALILAVETETADDNTRVYVAGKGVVFVIDTLTFKLIDTIKIPAGRNIASLATVGNLLLIGEGDRYGTKGGYRLLAMDINPGSPNFNQVVTLKNTGAENSPSGITGLVVGPDGKTLVVAVPNAPASLVWNDRSAKPGDILVLDLSTLDMKTGKLDAPIKAQLPNDGRSGRSPQIITATQDADRYLVCNVLDTDKGLSTLVITRDADDNITGAKLTAIRLFQPTDQLKVDRLDIQRAQSAVLVEQGGVEYAIVADDNYDFLDPYYQAMYEAPSYLWTPDATPIAVGGSVSAKKVAVGGKLGIVKDPFGKLGDPQFIGATLPLDGYGIINLSLSPDGKVLLGQLNGKYSSIENGAHQQPHQSHAWSVTALIDAALANPEKDRMRKHIRLASEAEVLIPTPATAPVGTFFDADPVKVSVVGNLGDIIGVNMRDLAARQLLVKEGKLTAAETTMPWEKLSEPSKTAIGLRMADLSEFTLSRYDLKRLVETGDSEELWEPTMTLVAKQDTAGKLRKDAFGAPIPVSRFAENSTTDADYEDSGVLYFTPNITKNDEDNLRAGKTVPEKYLGFFFRYKDSSDKTSPNESKTGYANVTAKDYANVPKVFFGDRPLDNPGYSAFNLKGEVRAGGSSNDVLDVYRVEQRLKYLGYPAMGTGVSDLGHNTLQNFTVDGKFKTEEEAALKLFEKVVRYGAKVTATGVSQNASISVSTIAGSATATINLKITLEAQGAKGWDVIGEPAVEISWLAPKFSSKTLTPAQKDELIAALHAKQADANDTEVKTAIEKANADALKKAKNNADAKITPSLKFMPTGEAGADGILEGDASNKQRALTLTWLNAYNAPHWMQLFGNVGDPVKSRFVSSNPKLSGWVNGQTGDQPGPTNVEDFGTSWLFDLMVAKQFVSGLAQSASRFNGAVDANYGFTPKWKPQPVKGQHWTHDLGMAFDLGISNYTNSNTQDRKSEPLTLSKEQLQKKLLPNSTSLYSHIPNQAAYEAGQWNYANAVYLAGLLPADGISNNQAAALRDFLSLYTATRRDAVAGNGSWEELPVQNGEAVRATLFGTGLDDGMLISGVHIGGDPAKANPYRNINDILSRLGVASSAIDPHKHHFHLYLLPPAPLSLPRALQAETASEPSVLSDDLQTPNTSGLLAAVELLVTGDEFMMSVDIPYLPLQEVPVLVAQATSTAGGLPQPDYLVRDCTVTEHTGIQESAFRSVDPAGGVRNYMEDVRRKPLDITEFKPILLQGPSHGAINYVVENSGHVLYTYDPVPGYLGKDRAVFMVEYHGQYFKVVTEIKVVGTVVNYDTCPPNRVIKLRKPSRGDAGQSGSSIRLAFADLPNGELGSTTGTTITLDANAAGHGWFIDSTPTDNAEFLPTSNPNEWVAKAGSEAYGKMDMLTVLLHEYGHALGLEHSTDAHDFMATTLQPGVRRTLTVDDQLALMQLAGFFPTPDSPSAPYGPTDPGAPLPFTRVLSNARNARLRREEGLDALVPQFDTVANPKLTNPEFAGAQGWATTGDVAFTNGAATLSETATTQTRLNQVFVLGEHDRYLSFTLANTALGDQANGPDDAFEVALIDASTGLSLMGGTGLSRNDAIVNRQADGSEYKATGINVVNNNDGSRTYLVDLAGIPAGTVVNLAFDLIGFGSGIAATNSHLTIRDLHLGELQSTPQTTDDAATLAEDTSATIDALANDRNAKQPGFVPVVVTGPAHGQVAIDADGRFTYTPEANWNGVDGFTYALKEIPLGDRLSNGQADSNLATVTLTITPVNDAPVIAARSVTLDEDGTAIVDLLAGASDVDGDALSVVITTAPQHGTFNQNVDGTWTYVPAANWNGTDAVEYEVSDGMVAMPTRVRFIVSAVNDAPVLAGQTLAGFEDAAITGNLLATATDMDSTTLTSAVLTYAHRYAGE